MKKNHVVSSITMTCVRLAIYIVIAVGLVKLGQAAYGFGFSVFTQKPMERAPGTDVTVTVKAGVSTYELGKLLQRKGLVEDAKLFYVQELVSNYKGKLRPGSYILNTSYDVDTMLAIMAGEEIPETGESEGEE